MPSPASVDEEVQIVTQRVAAMASSLSLPQIPAAADEIRRVVTVFRELRNGQSDDGRIKFKTPSGTMSTAEAISVMVQGIAMAAHLGNGTLEFTNAATEDGGVVSGHFDAQLYRWPFGG